MARFIEHTMGASASSASLLEAHQTGVPVQIELIVDGLGECRGPVLHLRVADIGRPEPFARGIKRFLRGYVGESPDAFSGVALEALDRGRVQYVEGEFTLRDHVVMLHPCPEPTGNDAPGIEPWLVLARPGQTFVEPVTVVLARSEAEAATRARLAKNGVRDLYTGRTEGGETYICTLRRLAACPSF